MSQLLFLVGLGLIFIGKLNVGDINVEGRIVRAAGAVLALPLFSVLVLGQVLHWLGGSNIGGEGGGRVFLVVVELAAMIICSGAAYVMLKRASVEGGETTSTVHKTPNLKIQPKDDKPAAQPPQPSDNDDPQEKQNGSSYSDLMRSRPQMGGASRKREDFPAVMDIREAARYLNKTEKEVLKLIDQGRLAAARINYRFRISRTVLDEFIEDQKNSSDPSSG